MLFIVFLRVGYDDYFSWCGFRYEQAEIVERELEQMAEQIKTIIQTLNANQVMVGHMAISPLFLRLSMCFKR